VAPVGTRRHPQGIVTVACALLATCALAFAAISILEWSRATRDTGARDAAARDSVLTQARIDIAVLNTIDYTKASTGLQRWASATTGGLHDQIASSLTTAAKTITGTKTSTTAVVVAAAVTSLDVQHGTSTVIASVQLTKTPDAGQSVVDRNRLKATMTRVAGTWRVSDLAAVSVELP
jgi:Mce-associated membrane protein